MIPEHVHWVTRGLLTAVAVGLLLTQSAAYGQQKEKLGLEKIPTKVMHALKAKFPKAEIHKWDKEKEGDEVVYDFEFKQDGGNFEADIKEDGTIDNWEKEIGFQELPKAVRETVEKKYPRSTITEIMQVTAIRDGKEALEGYEVSLKTPDKKHVEVTVDPDGKILEDSGDEE